MKTIEKIQALVAENPAISCSEIAEKLGLTRQRISQVCKSGGIVLESAYPARDRRGMGYPRVITGGIQSMINHTVGGTISELLVAADLMARGYKPYTPLVRQRSHDIIAVAPCGEILTFEVKSGKRRDNGNGYTFASAPRDVHSDHYAVVITGEPVIYKPELDPSKERPKALYKAANPASRQEELNSIMDL